MSSTYTQADSNLHRLGYEVRKANALRIVLTRTMQGPSTSGQLQTALSKARLQVAAGGAIATLLERKMIKKAGFRSGYTLFVAVV